MSVSVADHIRWMGQMNQGARYGATAGDSFHQGTYDYSTSRPYPNGLPTDPMTPGETQWWRDRIERARQWIEMCRQSTERDQLAERLSDDDVHQALERLIQWEQSQQQTRQNSTHS